VPLLPTPVILITTTGRKSGNPYTTPVGYMIDGDRYIVVPSSATADWYLNVLANPQVTVELGTQTFTATTTLVEGEQRATFLQQARQIAAAAASAWRPAGAGDMADHVAGDGPVVALRRVDR
jgi:deazaflavin-dependent oxidoreductase (nitroreductase family)